MPYSASLPNLANAAACYAAIADLPWAVWLDSAELDRYDILCARPVATLVTRGTETEITDAAGTRCTSDDPFDLIRQQLGEPVATMPGIPFSGGALGYWGYDLVRRMMPLSAQVQDIGRLPDMAIGIYDWAIVFDHRQKTAQLVSQQRYPETKEMLPEILDRLRRAGA